MRSRSIAIQFPVFASGSDNGVMLHGHVESNLRETWKTRVDPETVEVHDRTRPNGYVAYLTGGCW